MVSVTCRFRHRFDKATMRILRSNTSPERRALGITDAEKADLMRASLKWTNNQAVLRERGDKSDWHSLRPLDQDLQRATRSLCPHFLYQSVVFLFLLIFLCSCKNPYSSASAVGGQPGTYRSTGTILSQPLTTEYE